MRAIDHVEQEPGTSKLQQEQLALLQFRVYSELLSNRQISMRDIDNLTLKQCQTLKHPVLIHLIGANKITFQSARNFLAYHMPLFDCGFYCHLIEKQEHKICWEVLHELSKNDCELLLREDVIEFVNDEHLDINTVFRQLKNKLIDKFGVTLVDIFLHDMTTYHELHKLQYTKPRDFVLIKNHAYIGLWLNNHFCTIADILEFGLLEMTINIYASRLYQIHDEFPFQTYGTKDTIEMLQEELKIIAFYHQHSDNELKEKLTHALLKLFKHNIRTKKVDDIKTRSLYKQCITMIEVAERNNLTQELPHDFWQNTLDDLICQSQTTKDTLLAKPPKRGDKKWSPTASIYYKLNDSSQKKSLTENVTSFCSSLKSLKTLVLLAAS